MVKKNTTRFLTLMLGLLLVVTGFNPVQAQSQLTNELALIYGDINITADGDITVIIELDEVSIIEAKHSGKRQSEARLAKARLELTKELEKIGGAEVLREYSYLFSGLAVNLPSSNVPKLLNVNGIKAVYEDVEYQVIDPGYELTPDAYNPYMLDSAPFIGAAIVWEEYGFTGKGVTVAIIDTGVDYTHPDLAHAFGDNKGWDFVDNNADPQETPPGDPRGDATNHGTHVAGTVAANGMIKGVAPDATLLAYRVLGPGGSGSTVNVLAGIEQAVLDGADVINLSLGNTLNSPDFATSIALDWAMAEGVVAVTSNGNSGPENWTVGSPGASRHAISVGATQLPYNVYGAEIVTESGVELPSFKIMGYDLEADLLALEGIDYEVVFAGLGTAQEFAGMDLTGKVALVVRGDIPFWDKAVNAKAVGAEAIIIFNNAPNEEIPFILDGIPLPTFKMTLEDGQKLFNELQAGNDTVSFNLPNLFVMPETVADFSSRGPVASSWMIKPDVSAPGVQIISTIPTHNPAAPHGYGAMNGTSMSSPHVAGAAALLLQANPSWNVDQVKAALMNTAEVLADPMTGQAYPHNTQGAGSIRIDRALTTQTLVTPGSYSFGIFEQRDKTIVERQHFAIQNLSGQRKRYTVEVEIAGNPEGIRVAVSNNVQVQPGRTQQVNLNVQVDTSKLAPGYYEGTFIISDGTQQFRVPTILFVGEPDYPRITHAGVSSLSPGILEIWGFLPGGADIVEAWIYSDEPWAYVGDAFMQTDVAAGYVEFEWDYTINGQTLPRGVYHVFVYAQKGGVGEYLYAGPVVIN